MTNHAYNRKWYAFFKLITLDFTKDNICKMEWFPDLNIKLLKNDRVSISQYSISNWKLVADPEVIFLLKHKFWEVLWLYYKDNMVEYQTFIDNNLNDFHSRKLEMLEKFTNRRYRDLKWKWFII